MSREKGSSIRKAIQSSAVAAAWVVVLTACWSLASVAAAAGENAVRNGSFENGLAGWVKIAWKGSPPTEAALDATQATDGKYSVRIAGNGRQAAIVQSIETPRDCGIVRATWSVKAEKTREIVSGMAIIGVDLAVTLASGKTIYHIPAVARVRAHETGKWLRKGSSFLVPLDDPIASIKIFCINYNNSGNAWFDDVQVEFVKRTTPREGVWIAAPFTEKGERMLRSVEEVLNKQAINYSVVPLPIQLGLEKCRLLILIDFTFDEEVYRCVRDYFYTGGRVIACELPDGRFADAIRKFIWGASRPKTFLKTPDGRGRYYPKLSDFLSEARSAVRETMHARPRLPERIEMLSFSKRRKAEIRNSILLVDGKPRFIRAMGAYFVDIEDCKADFARFAAMGMNAVVTYIKVDMPLEDFVRVLDTAEECGLLLIIWFKAPRAVAEGGGIPLKPEWLLKFLRASRHPALLSWLISDDTQDRHYPILKRITEIIKRYDEENFVTATLFGFRYPDRISPESWAQWKMLLDYPTTYDYPLNKDNRIFTANICVGLEDIQKLSRNVHKVYGGDVYFHLWSQSHLQNHVRKKLGIGAYEHFLAGPEQLRLLTYMMISSGARGILYFFARAFNDEFLGAGRRHELTLMWRELSPFEEFIAAGRRLPLRTNRDDVEAVAFERNDEWLILAIKHGGNYHRCVSDGMVNDLVINIENAAIRGAQAWRVDLPTVRKVACSASRGATNIEVGEFYLTCLILVSNKPNAAQKFAAARERQLAQVAEEARLVCRDKMVKTIVVAEEIRSLGGVVPKEAEEMLKRGSALFNEALQNLQRKEHADAYTKFRSAMAGFADAQRVIMLAAERAWREAGSPADAEPYLNMYFTLPNFYCAMSHRELLKPNVLGNKIRQRLEAADIK